jgi:hypothetical protein
VKSRDQGGEARRSIWGVLGRFAVRASKLEWKAHWGGSMGNGIKHECGVPRGLGLLLLVESLWEFYTG